MPLPSPQPTLGVSSDSAVVWARSSGSENEESDLRKYYMERRGDLRKLLYHIPLSRAEDRQRFTTLLSAAISDGSLESFPAFAETRGKIEECVDEDSDGEDIGEEEDEEEEEEVGDESDLDDFLADEDEAEEEAAAAAAAEQEEEEEEEPLPPPKKAKRAKTAAGGGGGGGAEGIDPALLAMFASKNASRAAGLDDFAARWGAKSAGAAGGKKKGGGAKAGAKKRKKKR